MASLGQILSKTFFWSYERGTWQFDLAVILILVFVLATPRGWFHDKPESGGPAYVMLDGAEGRMPLSVASGQYPQFFSANLVSRPTFVSASPRALADFRLEPSSPGVAAGTFLTHAVRSATSNRLSVQDSLYFTDGNGVIPGDTIELEGTTDRPTIVAIDHSSNTLMLSTPVAFTNGQGVALPYNGTAPDIGIGSAP